MNESYIFTFDAVMRNWLFDDMADAIDSLYDMTYISDGTIFHLNSNNYELTDDLNYAEETGAPYIYIRRPDQFNALALENDYRIIIVPELLKTLDNKTFKLLYYTINIDYNPIYCSNEALALMNHVLNLQDEPDDCDDTVCTRCIIGLNYVIQRRFQEYYGSDCVLPDCTEVSCIMFIRPNAQKINTGKANYLRQSIDMQFMISLGGVEFIKDTQKFIKVT